MVIRTLLGSGSKNSRILCMCIIYDYIESAMTTTGLDLDNGSRETANCVLLDCPETKDLMLVNVTGVDYYSAYPDAEYKGI